MQKNKLAFNNLLKISKQSENPANLSFIYKGKSSRPCARIDEKNLSKLQFS
jgi:hypothetical protein